MKTNLLKSFLFAAAAVLASQLSSSAQVVVALNPTGPIVTDTVNPAAFNLFFNRIGGGNYSDPNDISNLGLTETQENETYPETFATGLTINGTTYSGSGVVYNNAGPATAAPITGTLIPGTGTPVDFVTYQFGTSFPVGLKVGLDSNYLDTSFYKVVLENSSGGLLSSALLNPLQTKNDNGQNATPRSNNDFYYADVTGIRSGDFLVLQGFGASTGGATQVTLGAVTFDYIPEPSTYALFGLGGLALALFSRRVARKA